MAGAGLAAGIAELFVLITAITLLWPGAINSWLGQPASLAP